MPYGFIYDLTKFSQSAFNILLQTACEIGVTKLFSINAKRLVKFFNLDQLTGLNLAEAVTLVEDLIEVQNANSLQRKRFEKAENRALLVPHCARSHMDRQCMADFNPEIPSYNCNSCQEDCLVNKVGKLGKEKGYDVYVIPGGSCAEKILRDKKYNGVVGIACGHELKMALDLLKKLDIPGQGVILTRNGCANTNFNMESLKRLL
ncbi:MAG: DUF116 domain-containing protein [Candidatus Bathyarchaeota archaeon]|nr:MAG: DUF116 domain-containing protein [Candidatus Bathyarchaeota archaeon]